MQYAKNMEMLTDFFLSTVYETESSKQEEFFVQLCKFIRIFFFLHQTLKIHSKHYNFTVLHLFCIVMKLTLTASFYKLINPFRVILCLEVKELHSLYI